MWDAQINRRRFLQVAGTGGLAGSAAKLQALAGLGPDSRYGSASSPGTAEHMGDHPMVVKLITLDPAHFHAALVQKQMLPGISPRVSVFAPLGPDLLAHLKLIEQFNQRTENPTRWELEFTALPAHWRK